VLEGGLLLRNFVAPEGSLLARDLWRIRAYPPMWTIVREAGTKSGSPMWCRSSFL